jgi:large subunit ribosomal protein L10
VNREQKQAFVDELTGKVRKAQLVVLADYTGLNVEKFNSLRRQLEKVKDVEVQVVKNKLCELAVSGSSLDKLKPYLKGPTAVIIGYDDIASPSKVLNGFVRENGDKFKVKAGIVGGALIDAEGVKALENMPSRETLLGQLLGTLQAPLAQFLGVLSAVPQQFLGVLSAYEEERKKSGGAA